MIKLIQLALRKAYCDYGVGRWDRDFSILSIKKTPVDIFPAVNAPTIYVAQTYGGLSPQQMEGYVTFTMSITFCTSRELKLSRVNLFRD